MKVALLADIAPYGMKGLKNYVVTKATYLQKKREEGVDVDFYIVNIILPRILCWLLKIDWKKSICNGAKSVELEGIKYNLIFIKRSLFNIIYSRITKKESLYSHQMTKMAKSFSHYDILTTHSYAAQLLAMKIKEVYNIPFVTTWHGSDIHTTPYTRPGLKQIVAQIIKDAAANFFVSKDLLRKSNNITNDGVKDYVYTGVADGFYEYNTEKKKELRKQFSSDGKKVVAFSGNLFPIKNPLSLPKIFWRVNKDYDGDVVFWIIGDGELHDELKWNLDKININYKMFGNVKPVDMPDLINCIDVLILPSLNEGLPLSMVEARKCGVMAVGSNRGGIPEAVGKENTFALDDNFAENISSRIIEILNNNEKPKPLSDEFSWDSAVDKEINVFKKVLGG